jgi:glycosyltransferase involved in cell wall biosynthesis
MKFSIITPTYQRPDKLNRAIESVLQQEHKGWELIIINDNPGDGTKELISSRNDNRIIFAENTVNSGVNFSRNRGLDMVSPNSDYIIFLDDDDYFENNTLLNLSSELLKTPHSWLLTARGYSLSEPTTISLKDGIFSYAWDYLITKKISGDATHAIATRYITGQVAKIRFPSLIRQAEEWLFYFELSLLTNPYYINMVTTITDGYGRDGLNLRPRNTREQLKTLSSLLKEGFIRGLTKSFLFFVYLFIRLIRAFIKK